MRFQFTKQCQRQTDLGFQDAAWKWTRIIVVAVYLSASLFLTFFTSFEWGVVSVIVIVVFAVASYLFSPLLLDRFFLKSAWKKAFGKGSWSISKYRNKETFRIKMEAKLENFAEALELKKGVKFTDDEDLRLTKNEIDALYSCFIRYMKGSYILTSLSNKYGKRVPNYLHEGR